MTEEDTYKYLSGLWAMLIWGNKHYLVEKIIEENGFSGLRKHLADLVWGTENIQTRWDQFRIKIKGIGPAMASELLCKTHPDEFMIWNRRAYIGLNYLEVENLPRYDYQLDGKRYKYLCDVCKEVAKSLSGGAFKDTTLLEVKPVTGRTHQIRVHLAAAGHPICGDPVYGRKKEPRDFPRIFLHAHTLSFLHPESEERLTFASPLPPDLEAVIARELAL